MEAVIELFKFLYYHKGTVGTSMVALGIWHSFGISDAFIFIGIVLMVVGCILAIAKAINS